MLSIESIERKINIKNLYRNHSNKNFKKIII